MPCLRVRTERSSACTLSTSVGEIPFKRWCNLSFPWRGSTRLDSVGTIVKSDESRVIYVHAGLPGRKVVPTSGNMSLEEGENIAPERATPAWWRRLRGIDGRYGLLISFDTFFGKRSRNVTTSRPSKKITYHDLVVNLNRCTISLERRRCDQREWRRTNGTPSSRNHRGRMAFPSRTKP